MFDAAAELLQDFLVEAGELLDGLDEQLMALEHSPEDPELLNALFRSFHTVKGGAGFLGLGPLVEVCHRAEDVFNGLRQGALKLNPEIMDAVLAAVDAVTGMFDALRAGEQLEPAAPELLARLEAVQHPAPDAPPAEPEPAPTVAPPSSAAGDEITDEEFERLLDELHAVPGDVPARPPEPAAVPAAPKPPESKPAKQNAPAPKTPAPPAPEPTLRVDTARLDTLMNLVGELVLVRNRLVALRASAGGEAAECAVSSLDLITSELQSAVMRLRLQPVRKVFGRFPRVARDTARALGKEVELELDGEETELDKNLVEMLADPLVHLVRNAVDHGIESPEQRTSSGKPRAGRVELSAAQEGNTIVIAIRDDGKGMDPEVLRRKAVEKGLMSSAAAQQLSDAEAWDLIFTPGFSTRTEVSDVSGRGVGMDVVRTAILRLNGAVTIDSQPGAGTSIEIRLPLTLAIFPTLLISVGGLRYALPLSAVRELLELENCRTRRVEGREVVMVREETMPLHCLAEWFRPGQESPAPRHAIVVDLGGGEFAALAADALLGQEDVVIKPLGSVLEGLPGFSGATITGDGGIALIIDPRGLVSRYVTGAPERLAS